MLPQSLQTGLLSLLAFGLSACLADSSDTPAEQRPDASLHDAAPGPGDYSVVFQTTAGEFTVDVTRNWSPNGADRFRQLVEDKFFDGAKFFRVVPGFVVQFGLNGSPAIDAQWVGNTITDDTVVESNGRGTLTFAATAAPNSRTTQIFVNYTDNRFLDSQGFSPFGKIRGSGMEVVDAINSQYGEQPQQDQIRLEGNSYLDTSFPNLDAIVSATIQ